jgi:hypothetical protein
LKTSAAPDTVAVPAAALPLPAAVAAPDPERGAVVRAVVVLREGAPSEELVRELQEHCKEETAPYKFPRIVDFAAELPKTPSGKIRRAELRAGQAWELFGEVYEGRVRRWTLAALRWSVVALVALVVLGLFRRTRRTRRFLYRQLVRHLRRPPPPRPVYAPTSSYGAQHAHAPLAGPRAAFARTAGGLLRLALHERGRAALALNLFTHGLLTVLLWAVLWAMQK